MGDGVSVSVIGNRSFLECVHRWWAWQCHAPTLAPLTAGCRGVGAALAAREPTSFLRIRMHRTWLETLTAGGGSLGGAVAQFSRCVIDIDGGEEFQIRFDCFGIADNADNDVVEIYVLASYSSDVVCGDG